MATLTAVPEPAKKTAKAHETRGRILDAAMTLFRRDGYDRTTMRAVASKAGVSTGNAYYYFSSKEHLVQAFYDSLQVEHAAAAAEGLATESGFAARMTVALTSWLEVAAPHHEFAGQFFRNAADPDLQRAPQLRREVPARRWLLQIGLVLFLVPRRHPRPAPLARPRRVRRTDARQDRPDDPPPRHPRPGRRPGQGAG